MFAKLNAVTRCASAVILVTSILGACGSHVGDAQAGNPIGDTNLRDPENPYWQARPLNFDSVDPAQGPGMR